VKGEQDDQRILVQVGVESAEELRNEKRGEASRLEQRELGMRFGRAGFGRAGQVRVRVRIQGFSNGMRLQGAWIGDLQGITLKSRVFIGLQGNATKKNSILSVFLIKSLVTHGQEQDEFDESDQRRNKRPAEQQIKNTHAALPERCASSVNTRSH